MIGRLIVVAAGIVAAGAGAAAWARRQAERDAAPEEKLEGVAEGEAPAEAATEAPTRPGDDLQAIKGIGAVSEERLRSIGITAFDQIADWSPDEMSAIAAKIKVSPERIKREDWVGQARAATEG